MAAPAQFEALILGSGQGGKLLAWHLADSGRRTAVVERHWIGGSCPNVNCMPSKNEIWSAGVAHVARHAAEFGTDRKSTRLNSSHLVISYAVFCLKKKNKRQTILG